MPIAKRGQWTELKEVPVLMADGGEDETASRSNNGGVRVERRYKMEIRRIQVQQATATRPRTQIRAHRRAARMTTKSESTLSGSCCCSETAVVDEF